MEEKLQKVPPSPIDDYNTDKSDKKGGAQTHATFTSGDGKEFDIIGTTKEHVALQPGAALVEMDPEKKEVDVKGSVVTKALVEKGAKLVEVDPEYHTNFWTGETNTAVHVKGETKPTVLIKQGAALVQMDPKYPVNYWTDEYAARVDVDGAMKSNVLVSSNIMLVEASADTKDIEVKGAPTEKALLQTASVQLVETDATTKEVNVTGTVANIAQLQPGALLVESNPELKVYDVKGTTPKKALIKTANVQLVETDSEYKEYQVTGPTFNVALVQKGATLIALDPAVTVNYWTDEKEAVLDVTGDVQPKILMNQGVTMVEMDPDVVLNFWTNEYGASYDIKGDVKPNVLLKGGIQLMEAAGDPLQNGAAVIEAAKDAKSAQMEVEVKDVDEDMKQSETVGNNIGPVVKQEWSKWNKDMKGGIARCLQVLVDLDREVASFKLNVSESNIRKIGDQDVNELVNRSSIFHDKMNRYHSIIRAIKVCSDAFLKNMDAADVIVNEYTPDVNKYTSWDLDDIMLWIKSLDNGRFVKYLKRLTFGFTESDILNGEILPDLETADLAVPPFNMKNFRDKRDLIRNFKSLKAGKARPRSYTRAQDVNNIPTQQDIMQLIYSKDDDDVNLKTKQYSVGDVVYVKKKVQTFNIEHGVKRNANLYHD